MNCNFIEIHESYFVIKNIASKVEKEQAYRLRHEIFCKELNWLGVRKDEREIDSYDNYGILLGVFDKEEIIGIVRFIFSYMPMMIENEFIELISPFHRIQKNTFTVEATRFGIRSDIRRRYQRKAAIAMYKGIYLWSMRNAIRYVYMVVEKKMFRTLKMSGFPLRKIGPVKKLKGEVESLSAILDWREFESTSKLYSCFYKEMISNSSAFATACPLDEAFSFSNMLVT